MADAANTPADDAISAAGWGGYDGDKVPVVAPDGTRGTLPRAELGKWLGEGYRVETTEETHQRFLEKDYGDSPVTAGLLGVARGATLGLSDVYLGKLLGGEGVRETRERNAGASLVGEVAGAVAPALLSGGTTAAGSAARAAAATPAGLATRAGIGVEAAVARAAGPGAVGRFAAKAAGQAAEGALFGAGEGISQLALSEDPITAERAASVLLKNTALGGAVGAGATAAGEVAGAVLRPAARAAQRGLQAIADQVKPPASVADDLAEIAKRRPQYGAARTERKVTREQLDELRRQAKAQEAAHAKAGKGAKEQLQPELDAARAKLAEAESAYKAAQEAPAAPKFSREEAARVRQEVALLDQYSRELSSNTGRFGKQVIPHFGSLESVPARMRQLQQELNESMMETRRILAGREGFVYPKAKSGGWRANAKKWESVLDDDAVGAAVAKPEFLASIKRQESLMKEMTEEYRRTFPPTRTRANLETYDNGLAEIHGKAASAPSRGLDDAMAARDAARAKVDTLEAQLQPLTPEQTADLRGKIAEAEAKIADLADDKLADRYYSQIVNDARVRGITVDADTMLRKAKEQGLDLDAIDARAKVRLEADAVQEAVKARLSWGGGAAAAEGGIARELGTAAAGAAGAWLGNQITDGTGLGWLFGGAVGGVLGKALQGKMQGVRSQLAAKAAEAAGKTAKAIDAFARIAPKVQRAATPAAVKVLSSVAYGNEREKRRNERPQDAAQKRITELARVKADPAGTRRVIEQKLQGVTAAAPQLAGLMADLQQRKLEYLASKMPRLAQVGDAITGWKDARLSDADLSKFARYVRAAEDPQTVLDDMSDGRLTLEAVDALRSVYPETYQSIQVGLIERLAELRDKLPYQKRLQLSIFFGVPVDSFMRPDMVARLQSQFASEPNTEGGTAPPRVNAGDVKAPSPTGAQKLSE